jgi:heptosyltransferase-3
MRSGDRRWRREAASLGINRLLGKVPAASLALRSREHRRLNFPDAHRILVIRGGALGDFLLTLPAIRVLRENFPGSPLHILGHRHITALAEGRYYADSTRSIEYGPLAGFFHPDADLDPDLCKYFSSFQPVISYLYDPDRLFERRLRMAGVKTLISASPKILNGEHAARQLSRPLEQLGLRLDDPAARVYPSAQDYSEARRLLAGLPKPYIAIHPGSGGQEKNWPVERWLALQATMLEDSRIGHVLIIGGESDSLQISRMKLTKRAERQTVLESLPLPILGATLSECALFIGHDSGISHLAAAVGIPCLLLFGPTDPQIWAPANAGVVVLRPSDQQLSTLETATVIARMDEMLSDVR